MFYDAAGTRLVASFTQGVGFTQWPRSDQPRFVARADGGCLCDREAQIEAEWMWEHHGRPRGPPNGPLEFRVNTHMKLRCVDAFDISVIVSMSSLKRVFAVGRPARDKDSFVDRMHRRRASGLLGGAGGGLGADWPSLAARTVAAAAINPNVAACRAAQERNERLPRLSASGREVQSFCTELQLPGTRAVVDVQDESTAHLAGYETLVGRNGRACRGRQRLALERTAALTARRDARRAAHFAKALGRGVDDSTLAALRLELPGHELAVEVATDLSPRVPRARVPRRAARPAPLPQWSLARLDGALRVAPSRQLLVVLASTRHTEGDKAAERMLVGIAHRMAQARARQEAQAQARAGAGAGAGAGASAGGEPGAAETPAVPEDPADAEEQEQVEFALVDCTRVNAKDRAAEQRRVAAERRRASCAVNSSTKIRPPDMRHPLMKRYDFTCCPMYCIYYAGRLVHCAATLNGFGRLESDMLAQITLSRELGQRGKFLPADFSHHMSEDVL
eukprot:g1400.t1